jgi:hypothetical protein
MTGRALRLPGMTKELRALVPVWLASASVLSAGAALGDSTLLRAGALAYVSGSLALGAYSIGHEYSHHTLALLLSHPANRQRILLIKLIALLPMLLTLGAIASFVLSNEPYSDRDAMLRHPSVVWLPALCAVSVVPWLTMLCRSPLAGVVFTGGVAGLLLCLSNLVGFVIYGADSLEGENFSVAVWLRAMGVLCAVAAVSGWRTFMRLEAIESTPGPELALPRWLRGGPRVRPRHPVWQLVSKDLHLQHITLSLVALYIVVSSAGLLVQQFLPEFRWFPLAPLTMFYLVLLSILIGSLASAEERQLGTLEWQTLLPMAAWRQWTVKAGVALGLAFALGIGLPAVLMYAGAAGHDFGLTPRMLRQTALLVVLLTACSLYLSSLCTSGLRALVLVIPAGFAVVVYVSAVNWTVRWSLRHLGADASEGLLPRAWRYGPTGFFATLSNSLVVALTAGLVALLLRFAFLNHRSVERSAARVWRQIAWVACFLAFVVLLAGILGASSAG